MGGREATVNLSVMKVHGCCSLASGTHVEKQIRPGLCAKADGW